MRGVSKKSFYRSINGTFINKTIKKSRSKNLLFLVLIVFNTQQIVCAGVKKLCNFDNVWGGWFATVGFPVAHNRRANAKLFSDVLLA